MPAMCMSLSPLWSLGSSVLPATAYPLSSNATLLRLARHAAKVCPSSADSMGHTITACTMTACDRTRAIPMPPAPVPDSAGSAPVAVDCGLWDVETALAEIEAQGRTGEV